MPDCLTVMDTRQQKLHATSPEMRENGKVRMGRKKATVSDLITRLFVTH